MSCGGPGSKFELWDDAHAGANGAEHAFRDGLPSELEAYLVSLREPWLHIRPAREALAALAVKPAGLVDATSARRHARAILARLAPAGPQRPAAIRTPRLPPHRLARTDPRFVFRRAWFSELPDVLAGLALAQVDGVLLDLGISSPQIDDAKRGLSFRHDGPLDMRMDPSRGESAAEFLARATVRELTEVLRDYGEERSATIARAVASARAHAPIVGTATAHSCAASASHAGVGSGSATRTFSPFGFS